MHFLDRLPDPRQAFAHWWFDVEEPKVVRVLYLVLYFVIMCAGIGSIFGSPDQFVEIGGQVLIWGLGLSFILGGAAAALSILPGVWILERVGLFTLIPGILLRGVLLASQGVSLTGALIFIALVVALIIRFLLILRADLAPKVQMG